MKELQLNIDDRDRVIAMTRALSSPTRLSIINLLNTNSYNINEISRLLDIPLSTTAVSIKSLEEAGLITVEPQPGSRGGMKLCSRKVDRLSLSLIPSRTDKAIQTTSISMPVGSYSECKIVPSCGLASRNGLIESEDDTKAFYSPKRFVAQLIWFTKGYLEYRIPMIVPDNEEIKALEISMEICSEAPNFRMDWPSDISFWINDVEIGNWTSPGDFGGRRGRLNPDWWNSNNTQYGLLERIHVDNEQTSINGLEVSRVNLRDLNLNREEYVLFRVGVKDNAQNVGGINIFGEGFGDYPQDILVSFFH